MISGIFQNILYSNRIRISPFDATAIVDTIVHRHRHCRRYRSPLPPPIPRTILPFTANVSLPSPALHFAATATTTSDITTIRRQRLTAVTSSLSPSISPPPLSLQAGYVVDTATLSPILPLPSISRPYFDTTADAVHTTIRYRRFRHNRSPLPPTPPLPVAATVTIATTVCRYRYYRYHLSTLPPLSLLSATTATANTTIRCYHHPPPFAATANVVATVRRYRHYTPDTTTAHRHCSLPSPVLYNNQRRSLPFAATASTHLTPPPLTAIASRPLPVLYHN